MEWFARAMANAATVIVAAVMLLVPIAALVAVVRLIVWLISG